MSKHQYTPESLGELFAVLTRNRLAIVRELGRGPTIGTRLAEKLGLSRATVSESLQVLKAAGVVEFQQVAASRVYSLTPTVHPIVSSALALLEG